LPRTRKSGSSYPDPKARLQESRQSAGLAFQEERRPVRPPVFIELENMNELARLTCALERAPLPVFAISRMSGQNGQMLTTQLDLFVGAPIFYYAYSNEVKQFLCYRTTATGEEVSLVDSPSNPALSYSPIIEILRLPEIFRRTLEVGESYEGPKFLSLQVKDLMSLVKVATYKVMFEEPPLPMFAFPSPKNDGWLIGTFTRIEEYEEASIFFYFAQKEMPTHNYVAYSTSKSQAFFTNRTDEHGNLYVEIIRLRQPHPLVEIDD
jgi:hypothetical protein